MWDIITIAGVLFILIIMAIVLSSGKGSFLIAGYNMMSKEKKEKADTVNFCEFMGKVVWSIGCSAALLLASQITGVTVFNTIALIILAISVITALVWPNVHYMAPTRK